MKKLKIILLPIISLSAVILLLYVISYFIGDELVFPSPTVIFEEFISLFGKSYFYSALLGDLARTLLSFGLSFICAAVFAVFAGINETFERLFYPITVILRSVPTMSVILWCLIVLKADKSPSAVSFIVTFPMLYSAIFGAVKNRDKKLDEMAKVFGVKKTDRIFKMIIPDVWKRLFTQFSSILSFNVKLIVAGEALAYTTNSLGRELKIANANLETAKLLALSVSIILLGVGVELAFKGIVFAIRRVKNGRDRKRIMQALR